MLNIIAWIVLGLIAGAIVKVIYPGSQGGGIVSTMVLGIIGAIIGGIIVTLLQTGRLQLTAASLSIPSVIVAVIGAIIAIFVCNLLANRASS
jgi:uncharacterized membrane protein YeaQ/YmgE (transglycosylase-associated protein family)